MDEKSSESIRVAGEDTMTQVSMSNTSAIITIKNSHRQHNQNDQSHVFTVGLESTHASSGTSSSCLPHFHINQDADSNGPHQGHEPLLCDLRLVV